ncbi:MAG: hypothetical protein M1365_08450 [Actinobacteria bacterium]|nr:hypothetical protein [Actinomycetota bacterium]
MEETITVQASVQPSPEPVAVPPKKKFLNIKWIVLGLIVLVLIAIGTSAGYFFLNSNKQIACTLEAKLCPDGSSVGRTGSKCEFAKCPDIKPSTTSAPVEVSGWKNYQNSTLNISFKYPDSLTLTQEKSSTASYIYLKNESENLTFEIVKQLGNNLLSRGKLEKTVSFNNISWNFYGSSSYCDAGECGDISPGYSTRNGSLLISFYIVKGTDSSIPEKILSTFQFNSLTPTPTCRPRPACLDATPRCLIPETSDMCPPTTTPSQ